MSYYDYKCSQEIEMSGASFYGIIMAAMRKADTDNFEKLRQAFPNTLEELQRRYNAPGGLIDGEGQEASE